MSDDTANGLLISARDAARLGKAEPKEIAGNLIIASTIDP
jgi:hypothetical protein